ncbi:MAG: lysine--tRNA ligase [Rhodospirillales bacterium]|nr:lysine--tRNA ligase [Rhodospirillales bacterium]
MAVVIRIPDDVKAWPFVEARRLVERLERRPSAKGYALFETGYGPSGLPHIGTFGEVARTAMVRHAFSLISDIPTRLFAYSDDMDGFRKVPDNLPNQDMLMEHLGKPLTSVPDPFGTHESLGNHNNARLRAFLDAFGFEYEFHSATDHYMSGDLDPTLLKVLARYDQVIDVILPTLGPERRATYSPFLPLCPKTGRVLQVPVIETNTDAGTIVYEEDGKKVEVPVTGGRCKLQWKADWAMRWVALDVDYEMSGKDLIDSVRLSSKICRVLGGVPPEGFTYELFLDEQGAKISKSKGNGLTIDEWLRYASPESLSLYMFQNPKKAKRLYFDIIPKCVDEYISHLHNYPKQDETEHFNNPVWHIHSGTPPDEEVPISFAVLLNLASAVNSEDKSVLWGFISRYDADAVPENHPILDSLLGYAIAYYQDFVKPNKQFRPPTDQERQAMEDLMARLENFRGADGETIQHEVYEVGKSHGFENLRDWFKGLYEVLFGQSQGPRIGSFFALYGVDESAELIRRALAGEDMSSGSAAA